MLPDEEVFRINAALAAALRARREELALSKNALAQKAGISVQAVSFIEAGTNSPSISTFVRLCDALKSSPSRLLASALKTKE